MARIREIVKEEYNSYGQFMPPNPWGHDVSVGREMEGGDDEDMQMDLQADLSTNPIPAFPIDEADITIDTGNKLIPAILQKLGDHGKPKFVGEGEDGIAFEVGSKIYKLTRSVSEVNDSVKIKGKRNAHLADIYDIYEIKGQNMYVIILEKLRTDRATFARLEDSTLEILNDIFGVKKYRYMNLVMVLGAYKDRRPFYDQEYAYQIKVGFAKHPQEKYYFDSLLKIVDELKNNGIKSMDIVYLNLGYKQNGNIAFFDLGKGGEMESLSPIDTIKLAERMNERVLSYMPNASAVSVKKKCRLGGNGDGTSTACNQGDINALDMKSINEEDDLEKFLAETIRQEIEKIDGFHRSDVSDELAQMTHPALNELEWTDTTGGDQDLVGMDGSVPMPNDSTYIPEGKDQKVEFGCAMAYFNVKDWNKITSIIDKEDIYDKPTFGVEKHPHVTILYGFHNTVKSDDVKRIIEDIIDLKKPLDVELTEISFFEVKDQDYDVVKFDVEAPVLHKLNKALTKLPHTSTHPKYHPHVTISYVKKGMAKKYAKKLKKTIKLRSEEIVYSTKKQSKTKLNENQQFNVQTLPFKTDIERAGGKIYSVGGAVRDGILKKPSKDLDLLITGVPMDKLEEILSQYGRTDNVGKSFGIIKFNTPQLGELDIAIPRTEKANGQGGYQGFDVSSDHELPIEKDLERRDFTINAMAKDMDGNMIDPYNGQQDLQDKMIRMVNPEAFKDDPLRMIRAVQFASRFGFQIEPKTMAAIRDNATRIREISPERILIEFDKIVKKGSPEIGAKLLADSGLYENIFGSEPKINYAEMQRVKTMGEFMYLLTVGTGKSPAEFYKTNLKGDLDAYNEIRAYELAYGTPSKANDVQTKLTIFNMNKTYPKSLQSQIIPYEMKQNILQMEKSGMPFSLKELAINGNDLLAMGYTGQQIGEFFRKVIIDIYSGKLPNNREVLLNYLTPNSEV